MPAVPGVAGNICDGVSAKLRLLMEEPVPVVPVSTLTLLVTPDAVPEICNTQFDALVVCKARAVTFAPSPLIQFCKSVSVLCPPAPVL